MTTPKKIKNYTTDKPAHQSVAEIQTMLVKAGASAVALNFDSSGNIESVFFRLNVDSQQLPFKLPVMGLCHMRTQLPQRHVGLLLHLGADDLLCARQLARRPAPMGQRTATARRALPAQPALQCCRTDGIPFHRFRHRAFASLDAGDSTLPQVL